MKRLTPLMFGLMMAFGVSGAAMAQGGYGAPDQGGAPDAGGAAQGGAPDAGGAPPAQGGMPGAEPAADFSEEDIQKFADVQPEIEAIRAEYAQRLQEAEDPEQAAELQNEAGQKMVDAVTNAGLDVETYNNIAIGLQTDAELRERVESKM